jgi:putative phosphoribosyl transferase
MAVLYRDRSEGGLALAQRLEAYRGRNDAVVFGLPRGGVVPAFEVAKHLGLPLDLIMVRKLTLPGEPPRAIGAITSGGHTLLNEAAIEEYGATEIQVHEAELLARNSLQNREKAYRGLTPNITIKDHVVIIVDDGMNSGATMQVAIASIRNQTPSRIVIAVPVAPHHSIESLQYADEVICLHQPQDFTDIDSCYEDFTKVNDDQVRDLLEQASEFPLRDVDIPPFT